MRKIYTPIAVLVASLIGLSGCHNEQKNVSTEVRTVQGVNINDINNNVNMDCEKINSDFDLVMKFGDSAFKTIGDWYNLVQGKYPLAHNGFNIFDHSHAKQQILLMNSLYGVFVDGVPIPKYGLPLNNSDVINAFQARMWVWRDLNKCSTLQYDSEIKGHDVKSIQARIAVLDKIVLDLIHGLNAVLEFDYTRFDKEWYPWAVRWCKQIYTTSHAAYQLHRRVNNIKDEVQLIDPMGEY